MLSGRRRRLRGVLVHGVVATRVQSVREQMMRVDRWEATLSFTNAEVGMAELVVDRVKEPRGREDVPHGGRV